MSCHHSDQGYSTPRRAKSHLSPFSGSEKPQFLQIATPLLSLVDIYPSSCTPAAPRNYDSPLFHISLTVSPGPGLHAYILDALQSSFSPRLQNEIIPCTEVTLFPVPWNFISGQCLPNEAGASFPVFGAQGQLQVDFLYIKRKLPCSSRYFFVSS